MRRPPFTARPLALAVALTVAPITAIAADVAASAVASPQEVNNVVITSADNTISVATEVTGVISGQSALNVNQAQPTDALVLTNNNTYTGGTVVQAGTLKIKRASSLGNGDVELAVNTTLETQSSTTLTQNIDLLGDATISTGGTNALENITQITSSINGAGSLTKEGAGTLSLTADNGYMGDTTIEKGTLAISRAGSLGSGSKVNIADGAVLKTNQDVTIQKDIETTGTGKIDTGGKNSTVEGQITGDILEKTGSGSLTLSNGYSNNVFLLKFNSIGNIIFAKDYLSSGSSVGYGIDIDFAQNCYITGYFYNELFAIPNNVQSVGSHDIFIAKTDIQGNIIWSRSAGGNSYDTGGGVSIDINGNVYITGYFNNASQFGSMVVNSSGGDDIFVAKYSNTGNLIWVSRTYGAGVYDLGLKIRTFNDKVYLVGQFEDVITIGSQIFSSFGLSDGFVSMLDSSGSFLWTKQLGGQGSDRLTDLNVVNNNNVFITGWCNGIAVFDNVIVSTGNNQNGIICLLDASGNLVNYKLASGNGNNLFNSIAVQQLGEVFVAGAVADTLFLDNLMIHSNGASDALIAKVIFEVNSSNEISLEGLKVLNNIFTNESSPFLVSSVMQNLHTLEIMDVKGSVLQKLPATILYPNEKFIIKNTFLKNLSLGVYYLKIVLKDSNKTQYFKIIKV